LALEFDGAAAGTVWAGKDHTIAGDAAIMGCPDGELLLLALALDGGRSRAVEARARRGLWGHATTAKNRSENSFHPPSRTPSLARGGRVAVVLGRRGWRRLLLLLLLLLLRVTLEGNDVLVITNEKTKEEEQTDRQIDNITASDRNTPAQPPQPKAPPRCGAAARGR
jgi:hypothetical protein